MQIITIHKQIQRLSPNVTDSKRKYSEKIKQALTKPVPVPFPERVKEEGSVFHPATDDLGILYAQNFTQLQGRFAFCESEKELASQLNMLFIKREWKALYCREEELKQNLQQAGFQAMTATDVEVVMLLLQVVNTS